MADLKPNYPGYEDDMRELEQLKNERDQLRNEMARNRAEEDKKASPRDDSLQQPLEQRQMTTSVPEETTQVANASREKRTIKQTCIERLCGPQAEKGAALPARNSSLFLVANKASDKEQDQQVGTPQFNQELRKICDALLKPKPSGSPSTKSPPPVLAAKPGSTSDFVYVVLGDGTKAKVKVEHLMPLEERDLQEGSGEGHGTAVLDYHLSRARFHGHQRIPVPSSWTQQRGTKQYHSEYGKVLRELGINDREAAASPVSMGLSMVAIQSQAQATRPRLVPSPKKMAIDELRGRKSITRTPRPAMGVPPTMSAKWHPAPGINGVMYYGENQNYHLDQENQYDESLMGVPCLSPMHQGKTILCSNHESPMSMLSPGDVPRQEVNQPAPACMADRETTPPMVKNLFAAHQENLHGEE